MALGPLQLLVDDRRDLVNVSGICRDLREFTDAQEVMPSGGAPAQEGDAETARRWRFDALLPQREYFLCSLAVGQKVRQRMLLRVADEFRCQSPGVVEVPGPNGKGASSQGKRGTQG